MTSGRDPAVVAALRAAIRSEVRADEPLARYSTYRIGGPATLVLPATRDDVVAALGVAREAGVPWFALGLGSNVLLPDEGLDAVVIRLGKGLDAIRNEGGRWTFGAGLPAPLAARKTAQAGWAGVHMMVGVPGTVGGGVFMNAGCHGGQWSDTVESLDVVGPTGEVRRLGRESIPFRYRSSGLERWIVLEATVTLESGNAEALAADVAKLFEWRQRGTPFNQPCCGSVFKNPAAAITVDGQELRTAGQLIEAAGLKGAREGDAEVSPMHANYFVNTNAARAEEIRTLIARVRQRVVDRFGVMLEPEVKVIGPLGEYRAL